MEGERELRGTWFRQERSSVVVVGPRVERCRVTDLSRRDRVSFSFVAFTWIKFDTECCSFRSHTAAYVRVTESQWQGNEHASTNVSPLRRKHDKQKIERKRRESWLGADWVVSRNFKRCNQPSKTRVVRSVRCRARRSLLWSTDVDRLLSGEYEVRGSVFVFQFLAVATVNRARGKSGTTRERRMIVRWKHSRAF